VTRARFLVVWAAVAVFAAAPVWAVGSSAALPPPGTDTIAETTAFVRLQLAGAAPETIEFHGPTFVQRGALDPKTRTIPTELSMNLQGTSPSLGEVALQAGAQFGTAPVTGVIREVQLDARGGLVNGISEFTFPETNLSQLQQQLHLPRIVLRPPLKVVAHITSIPPNVPVTTPPKLGRLDHFKCYSIKAKERFAPRTVALADQFQATGATVARPLTLCAPVSKNGGKVVAPAAHLKCYAIKSAGEAAKPKPAEVEVGVRNQLGSMNLAVLQPLSLCAPTLKRRLKPQAPPAPPRGRIPSSPDHFTCYAVRPKDPFQQRTVSLSDQFEVERATVLRPLSLCAPVEKNGVKIRDSVTHLTCYAIQDRRRTEKPGGRLVVTRNQLGVETLTVLRPQSLCVPSTKRPPCSEYAEQARAALIFQGQQIGFINEARHIPFKGVKDSPCE